jgi:threonine dehydratase
MTFATQTLRSTPSTDRRFGEVLFDDIVTAGERLARVLAPTPLVSRGPLSRRLGADTYVKLENASPLGSFRIRGSLNLLSGLTDRERSGGLVTVSRGSHGRALAHAARLHGVACTIFVPEGNASERTSAMAAMGATVIVSGNDFDAAWRAAREHAASTGALAVHPSREPRLVAGYGTVALEMLEQVGQPLDTVIVPVAGGSLASGVGIVFRCLSPHTRVIGVRAPAAAELPAETVAILRDVLDDLIAVSEAELLGGVRCLAETVEQLAEATGAAALAGALRLQRRIAGQRVGIILSGGYIASAPLARIVHGEMLEPNAYGSQLTPILADMEYGTS